MTKKLGATTGNIAVDMVYAAIIFYKRSNKKTNVVNLSTTYWSLFKSYMLRQGMQDIKDQVQFKNLLVRKGNSFMTEHLKCEFEETEVQKAYKKYPHDGAERNNPPFQYE